MNKILASTWYSPGMTTKCVGFVATETQHGWKAYIGIGDGQAQLADEKLIIMYGSKISKRLALSVFHWLDPDSFDES